MTGEMPSNDEEGRPMRGVGRRLVALAVLAVTGAVAGGLLGARPAAAHAQLLGSDPRADSIVTTQLDEITLTFNELVRGNFSTVVVTGPDGGRHGAGQPRAADKRVHLPVEPVRSGSYRVAYRVVSADGHPIQGQFRFTVALAPALEPTGAPATPPATADGPSVSPAAGVPTADTGAGAGLWGAGAAGLGVALVGAGFVLVRRRRRIPAR
ncbi:copper resistance protein CopC [Plantactinospora sp. KLBMP9567]|uniref:copper resistance CopC family protein n=1 Tax=Plantactinospora sp. KLBMP9567 TaxID=3085900 RepID=UPI00298181CD|nr:copper resistance protein CopC [Plantactinospora sp. KLBMP9567]MDW5322315.1 copper resistance protein CopC [Plantactinospora sp. KLBMP9567]